MGMVFCRGCGKEIHETATMCPQCGATQVLPSNNLIIRRILFCILWIIIIWISAIFLTGFVAGAFDSSVSGEKIGATISGPYLLIATILCIVLTIKGKLPGTKK